MTAETPDEKKPDENKPDAGKPARVPLRQRLRAKFNAASKSKAAEMIKDTAEDLRSSNKERAGLAAAVIIPGGFVGYYLHRRHKFKKKHADNDDALPSKQKKQQPPKP
jgi:hypothetical protein